MKYLSIFLRIMIFGYLFLCAGSIFAQTCLVVCFKDSTKINYKLLEKPIINPNQNIIEFITNEVSISHKITDIEKFYFSSAKNDNTSVNSTIPSDVKLLLYDLNGINLGEITENNLNSLKPGIYIINAGSKNFKFIKK